MILIVGGGSGLGHEFAKHCADAEKEFLIVARSPKGRFSRNTLTCDLANDVSVNNLIGNLIENSTLFESIVFFQRSRYHESKELWHSEIAVTVSSTRRFFQNSPKLLSMNGNRSIVTITSTVTRLLTLGESDAYHVSKSALLQLTKFYAHALGPSGIRINAISPFTFLKPENSEVYLKNESWQTIVREQIPLRRSALSSDIINVIDFFLSSRSSYITGQEIVVDGGLSLTMGASVQ